ncbi:MAG: hypothetical protein KGO51_16030 [Alphaproteobacteria bacterium]|nr:hypothetical protein [Alphaproteobacteria bacterium]
MSRRATLWLALLSAAALAVPAAEAAPAKSGHNECFLSSDWDGWSAPGDSDFIYLRVRMHDIWRLDLTPGTHVHKDPGYFLVNRVRGSNWLCSPLDFDLTLTDHHGFSEPLIVTKVRKLTPAEIAAIPKKQLP